MAASLAGGLLLFLVGVKVICLSFSPCSSSEVSFAGAVDTPWSSESDPSTDTWSAKSTSDWPCWGSASDMLPFSGGRSGLNVSKLDRALEWRDALRDWACGLWKALGVRRSLWSERPASEPLNEECSLSLPSLNQRRGSAFTAPVV